MPKDQKHHKQKQGSQAGKDKVADGSPKEPVLSVPVGEFMNSLRMANGKVAFRASVLHRIIARAEKRLNEQPEEPVSAKSKDKAGTSSEGGQSSELQAMLKAEFAAQRAEFAASIAALTTGLEKIERTGEKESKDASPKRKRKSATTEKAVEEVAME